MHGIPQPQLSEPGARGTELLLVSMPRTCWQGIGKRPWWRVIVTLADALRKPAIALALHGNDLSLGSPALVPPRHGEALALGLPRPRPCRTASPFLPPSPRVEGGAEGGGSNSSSDLSTDSALALRLGQHLNNLCNTRGAQEVSVSSLQGKTVGLYFSARWCSPCLKFTPKLIYVYANIKEMLLPKEDEDLEVVFVSTDRDQVAFKSYLSTMPWLALP
ncbi:hypothetical protein Taro_036431 [Colocasia esculenta]|uniref:protein-disulfide reductase n=1 Tax=Colocasia esculenta TaxID=4460 RepID=A0A843WHU5_COLES|nr:hypothetical protein [Colocasia esculenta]